MKQAGTADSEVDTGLTVETVSTLERERSAPCTVYGYATAGERIGEEQT